ncbi:MAG: hypothetical protein R3C05_20570 [Pirellulaceae bacterium]
MDTSLADLTGVDNLYSYGQSYARYVGRRYALGLDERKPNLPGSHPAWIQVYGVSAAIYRMFTVSGLIIAATAALSRCRGCHRGGRSVVVLSLSIGNVD